MKAPTVDFVWQELKVIPDWEFSFDGSNAITLNGVWLAKDGKEIEITDFLTPEELDAVKTSVDEEIDKAADYAQAMAEEYDESRAEHFREIAAEEQQNALSYDNQRGVKI